jgi:hypothetical protein
MSAMDATQSIDLGYYRTWADSERVAINVDALYKEWGGPDAGLETDVWTAMKRLEVA